MIFLFPVLPQKYSKLIMREEATLVTFKFAKICLVTFNRVRKI